MPEHSCAPLKLAAQKVLQNVCFPENRYTTEDLKAVIEKKGSPAPSPLLPYTPPNLQIQDPL